MYAAAFSAPLTILAGAADTLGERSPAFVDQSQLLR